jgi:signal transduction histidine kinase
LRIDAARLTERTRIAREMHDVLGHRLSLVSLHFGALEVRVDGDADRAEIATAAAVIRTNAHCALRELRAIIGVLRDTSSLATSRQPSLCDLPALATAAGTQVDLRCSLPEGLDGPVVRTIYRAVQEGLTNARKHAPGAPVSVTIDGAPGTGIELRLVNRIGGEPSGVPGSGAGLVGLAERVDLSGGRLTHETRDGDFHLTAHLPWPVGV